MPEGRFLLQAQALIPEHATYRLLVGPGPGCGTRPLSLYWIAYVLLPRAAVCSGNARWWVRYGAEVDPLPPGGRIVLQVTSQMQLLEVPTAGKSR